MKFIIFSDLQAHNYSQYSYLIDGVNSRLMDVLSVLSMLEVPRSVVKMLKICLMFQKCFKNVLRVF